jgi:uracil-DNA glycosylase
MAFQMNEFGQWAPLLAPLRDQDWFCALEQRVEAAYQAGEPRVFPPREDLFSALRLTPPDQVKCVIIGQDPYHEEGQAHGLSFSVRPGIAIPRSLKNIYKELQDDLGCPIPEHGCLEEWAKQGVLLLNHTLTVYEGQANSHKSWGWDKFTSYLIDVVEQQPQPIAYLLWGKFAQKKVEQNHLEDCQYPRLLLRSNHPSPLSASRGFLGSRPFHQVNDFLSQHQSTPIDWAIR